MPTMKATLPNGVTLEGPVEHVQKLLSDAGVFVPDGVHYNSKTLGKIRIADMTTRHLKNAVRKSYVKWAESLDTNLSVKEFTKLLQSGPTTDVTLIALVFELRKRV